MDMKLGAFVSFLVMDIESFAHIDCHVGASFRCSVDICSWGKGEQPCPTVQWKLGVVAAQCIKWKCSVHMMALLVFWFVTVTIDFQHNSQWSQHGFLGDQKISCMKPWRAVSTRQCNGPTQHKKTSFDMLIQTSNLLPRQKIVLYFYFLHLKRPSPPALQRLKDLLYLESSIRSFAGANMTDLATSLTCMLLLLMVPCRTWH